MKNLKQIIQEELLLEKRIAQISSNIEVMFSFDLIKHKGGHADLRSKGQGREDIEGYDMRPITNNELKYFVEEFKRDIAEGIVYGDIEDGIPFVIESERMGLATPLKPIKETNTYWKLVVLTTFRISPENPFRRGRDQYVISK